MSDGPTSGAGSAGEARRLDVLGWMFRAVERTWPTSPATGVSSDVVDDVGAAEISTETSPPPTYDYAPPLTLGPLPTVGVVDRHDRLLQTLVDIKVIAGGKVIQILRVPMFGPYGRDPSDPPRVSDRANNPRAICGLLSPTAAARCRAGAV